MNVVNRMSWLHIAIKSKVDMLVDSILGDIQNKWKLTAMKYYSSTVIIDCQVYFKKPITASILSIN